MGEILKKPSAWLPIAMSIAALLWTLGYLAVVGISQQQAAQDEGLGARIFQILMGGQLPIIVYFALRWFPQKPKQVFEVILLQIFAAFIPFLLVYLLEL